MAKKKKRTVVHYHYDREKLKQCTSVIGIDSSLTGFAFCKLITNSFGPQLPVRISTPSEMHHFERYKMVLDSLMTAVKKTSVVFMEGYAFGAAAGQSIIDLAGLGEQVRVRIFKRTGIEPIMVAPAQLKKFICGKGILPKHNVTRDVLARFDMSFETTDEAEAYVLAILGAHCIWDGLGFPKSPLAFQKAVVEDIRKEWFTGS